MKQFSEGNNTIAWGNGPRKLGGILQGDGDDQAMNLGQYRSGEESYKSQSQLFVQKTSLDSGVSVEVPSGYNALAFDTYTVNGTLTISGEMRVTGWPV